LKIPAKSITVIAKEVRHIIIHFAALLDFVIKSELKNVWSYSLFRQWLTLNMIPPGIDASVSKYLTKFTAGLFLYLGLKLAFSKPS